MGISLRAYARHRGVTLAAVQKARQTGRIRPLADGSIDPSAADAARRAAKKIPADPTRLVLPPGSLASAEATVRSVLVDHGVPADKALTLGDVRLANEILRAKQRADAIAAQEVMRRLRQRGEAIDKRIVDALIASVVQVICEYVAPTDAPAALDRLRALVAGLLPGTPANAHPPPETSGESLRVHWPRRRLAHLPVSTRPTKVPINSLPADGRPGGEAE